ncbi:MAG: GHKL domain-containing protein [Clostridia bacterium]|nr:GHKL domain-containing protein [Clostridia bacterium]
MPLGIRVFLAIEVTLCYVPGLLLRVFPFFYQISPKQKKTLCIVYPILILLNMLLLFFGLSDYETATALVRLDMLLIQFVLVGANVIVIKEYKREHLFTFGLVATCMYMLLSSATYLSKFFFKEDPIYQYLVGTGFYLLFMVIWYFPIRSMLKKIVSPFLSHKSVDYWKHVWFIPMMLYVSMFIALPLDQNIGSLALLLSRLFISISVIIFVRVVSLNHQTIMEKEALEEQLNHSKLHYAGMQTHFEASRKIKHDLKHILNAVRHYIDTNDKSGLSDFCDTVEETQLQYTNVPYTGCSAVDGVLFYYIKRTEKENIRFQYQGNLRHSGITDMDLCVMIGNALENAFEACLHIESDRFVTLTAERDGDIVSVMVQNAFDGQVKNNADKIISRKGEKRIGVGLQTISSVCEKYNGTMKTEWNDHTFTVLMVLTARADI